MKLADVSINRPVFAIMMSAALVVLGYSSYRELGLDLMPKTDFPMVSVSVSLPGASAEEIERQITKPLESAVNTISGIDELRSTSSRGSSRVNITFVLEKPIEVAVQDVRDKVSTAIRQFPNDADTPVVMKMDPDSMPILTLAVSGNRARRELTDIVDKKIKQILETVKDVGSVSMFGDRNRQVQLLLNADRMNAYGLTVDQVRSAVQRQNVDTPGGTFVSRSSEIALRTMGRIQSVEDFNKIVLTYRDGSAIRFGDIGRVVDTVADPSSIAKLDGREAIAISILKQSGTNTVEVVDGILARLETIKPTLPSDIEINTLSDQSIFIRKSFDEIKLHLLFGGLLASVVVFIFIRNIRTTIIAAVAIPTSIIGAFTVMRAFGFTMNNMTMLALSLATGIVIDDAIVVLENIFRYVEEKKVPPREAAGKATGEIGLAVMATTLSLCVIFLPVIFISGTIGQYLYSFGVVSAAAFLISMFVSFTLTPALCATWMRPTDATHKSSKKGGVYGMIDSTYGHMLRWSLRHRFIMTVFAAAVAVSAVIIYPRVGQELQPADDMSEYNINVSLPAGTSFQRAVEYTQPIEDAVRKLPEVQHVYSNVSASGTSFLVSLTPLEERDISMFDLMRQARSSLTGRFPGVAISVSGGDSMGGGGGRGGGRGGGGGGGSNRLNILLQGPEIEQLQVYVVQLIQQLRTVPGFVDVDTSFQATQPELRVIADRARAADLGVSIDSMASNLRVLIGGQEVSTFSQGDDSYDVVLRLDEQFRNNPETLGDLLVPATGKTVKVSDTAKLGMDVGPASIDRYNRQRQISVFAGLDNLPMGEAMRLAQQKIDDLNLKAGYAAVFSGSARILTQATNDFAIAIILAVAFIYMVLASQFNSFIHPLTIMSALPLSLPCGLLTLMVFGMTLNIYSAIGMLMLFGIVKKNSILQVDYTNTLRAQGLERHEAMLQACHVRLRPILMTTTAIIAGMLPIALGRGSGSASRAMMATTIIGGQTLCLLLTLLMTPVIYSFFDDIKEWSAKHIFSRIRHMEHPSTVLPAE